MVLIKLAPGISANDHANHVSGDTVVSCNNAIRSSWVATNITHLFRCQSIPAMASFVEKLFSACRPFTIRRKVAEVIVNSFNSPVPFWSWWTWPHVGKEVSESFWSAPAFADSDAAGTIAVEVGVVWFAPTMHRVPNEIFWLLGHVVFPECDGSSNGSSLPGWSVTPSYSIVRRWPRQ